MNFGAIAAIAYVAVEAAHGRAREIARAFFANALEREIAGPVSALDAVLNRTLSAQATTEARIDLETLPGETVLHVEHDGAAERIETEDRICAEDRRAIDRDRGDEIPVDAVAPRLVDAHAVLIDRETLRRADDGRGRKAAIVDLRLEWIAGDVDRRHARRAPVERLREPRLMRGCEIRAIQRRRAGRIFFTSDARIRRRERRHGDDLDRIERDDGALRLGNGADRPQDRDDRQQAVAQTISSEASGCMQCAPP